MATYAEMDQRVEKLLALSAKRPATAAEFQKKFELSWIYHDNALEGIVLSAPELISAVTGGAIADASLAPVFAEVRNHRNAIQLVKEEAENSKGKISATLIKKIYELLGEGIPGRDKALYRRDMPLHRTYFHDIAPPAKVPDQLQKLIDFCNTSEFKEYHPVKQSAVLHYGVMQVFPFTDNSGKVARLLMNLILLRARYLPAIIHAIDRQRYYETLRQPNLALRALVIEAEENSLDNAFKFYEDNKSLDVSHRRARASA